jgi:hypothetical protein
MELFRPEAEKLRKQIEGWLPHKQRELEATFGLGGQVDQTRFLAVAQRLKAKGYMADPPADYLTITIKDAKSDINVRRDTLKNNTRFTIAGSDAVEQYCRQESLDGLEYDVILKTAIGNPSEDDLVLEDYDMKFKVRREEERVKDEAIVTEIVNTWAKQKKAFRLIRRWTFQGDGCVFDLSMIRSNKRNASGAYIFTENFSDGDYNIMNEKPTYEIEVELKHSPDLTDADKAMSKLIKAVGEVLRGLQKNTILIRKSQKKRALDAYKNLVESDLFRGVKPRTLEMKNFIAKRIPNVPNIRDGYNVTDKADGLRVLGFCDDKGELFMIDKAMNVYRTGLQNENCRNSLVDGEWITTIKDEQDPTIQRATQQLWLFDIYINANKEKVDGLPFYTAVKDAPTRYKAMTDWYSNWIKDGPKSVMGGLQASNRLIVKFKTFEFAEKGNKEIFEKASRMLKRKTEYNTDGLIFTSNSAALPAADSNFREQFKWKPAEDNTIDFLVRLEKDKNGEDIIQSGIHPLTGNIITYKTLILKVGSTMDPSCANPRDTILYERSYPRGGCKSDRFMKDKSGKYKAVVFNPTEYADPMASICRVEVQLDPDTQLNYILTDKSKEPIQDKSIVEMRFDMKRPEGWRWVPVRVRIDKTEKLEKGELSGSLNADFTAEGVWNSIHNPITRGMISTGNDAPLKEELDEDDSDDRLVDLSKPYFERKANKQQLQSVEGLRNFHKHYIKGDMLLRPTLQGEGKYILDLAVGEAADINRWISNKAGFIYGMDIAAKGILDSHRGAYTKYINRLSENAGLPEDKQLQIPPMIFGIGDVSKSLATGEAGFNEEEANILRTVFGKVAPTGPVPPFVEHQGKDKLKEGADVVACMFALHYFFKDKETFQGLMKNIDQHLAVDGYFVACFFDGQKVFDLLKNKNEGESVSGTDRNTAIWKITKQYSNSTLPTDDTAFGLAIQNKFISIGAEHREYLVPFELLEAKMREIGCMLIPDAELKALGLPSSTETFDVSYKRATQEAKRAGKEVFPMIKAVQEYSFLNRWCIFKRYGKTVLNDDEEEEVMAKSLQTVKEEIKQETKPTEVKRPQSLAWQDVPSSGNDKTVAAIDEVKAVEERRVKEVDAVNVAKSALTMGKPLNEKPMKEGLASAMGDIKGVTVAVEPPSKEYEPEKIFAFGATEAEEDARYLAPYAPFEIIDNEDPANPVTYPSIQHFLAAMEYKKATNKPGYAVTVFSNTGSIHQDFIRKLLIQKAKGTPAEIKIKEQELLLSEAKEVALHTPARMFQKYSLKYDDALWATLKDKYLEIAYKARYQKDSKFRDILRKLRESDKYLLYRPTAKITTELGGILKIVRKNKKKMVKVEGENQLGKLLMSLAGFPGFEKIEPGLVGEEEE